jgi:hypothetical protein
MKRDKRSKGLKKSKVKKIYVVVVVVLCLHFSQTKKVYPKGISTSLREKERKKEAVSVCIVVVGPKEKTQSRRC